MFDLTQRVAVVTGASSGLGLQFATALAGQGADVALLARRADRLESLAEKIRAKGRKALALSCDVTESEQVRSAVAAVLKEFGKVDILVNSAGGARAIPAVEVSDEDWNYVMDININGLFYCCREFGRKMIKKGYGRIINIASVFGVVGNAFLPEANYHASKGAVVNLTRALGAEWARTGVTVNAIGPGFFATEMTQRLVDDAEFQENIRKYCPIGRLGKPGELNAALVYFASEESGYTTGTTLCVDGGWSAI